MDDPHRRSEFVAALRRQFGGRAIDVARRQASSAVGPASDAWRLILEDLEALQGDLRDERSAPDTPRQS
ncbi:hypothetical protein [Sphingomonas sp. 1P08PE]|uniref:hypothetical protein n=1 Tax=Sphingomonas sp. 1P08PE TaxID=554122 RepID=UPI0039A21D1E